MPSTRPDFHAARNGSEASVPPAIRRHPAARRTALLNIAPYQKHSSQQRYAGRQYGDNQPGLAEYLLQRHIGVPDRPPANHHDERRQTQERPVEDLIVAAQHQLQEPNHQPGKRREKEYDHAGLPAQERPDHHHQRHVAEAERLPSQRNRAHDPHRPHHGACADHAHQRRQQPRPRRPAPRPHAHDGRGARDDQRQPARSRQFAAGARHQQAEAKRKPAPPSPNSGRKRKAPNRETRQSKSQPQPPRRPAQRRRPFLRSNHGDRFKIERTLLERHARRQLCCNAHHRRLIADDSLR